MTSEMFTSRLGKGNVFPMTPFYEGDPQSVLKEALDRDLQLHKAHVVMLAEQGIISKDVARAIMGELLNLESLGLSGLTVDPNLGLYLSTEKHLVEKLGADVAGKLHTARSRNDLDPANLRMDVREKIEQIEQAMFEFQKVLLRVAEEHAETVMPGYTHHSQQAQPITFAHYLLAGYDAFVRDLQRLDHAYAVVNLCPLGGCALAGTGFPINRERLADLLGFSGIVENTLDGAGGNVDFILQTAAAIAISLCNLGRLLEGIYIWNTSEFGMLELADEYCSISSIMPQKKNPVALEMVRGEAVLAANRLNEMLTVLKAIPLGGGREWHYAERPFPRCVNTAIGSFITMAGILSTITVKRDVMVRRAAEGFGTATELADEIVRRTGLSFRQSHHIVGITCQEAIKAGKKSNEITSEMVDAAAREVIGKPLGLDQEIVRMALDPVENVRVRDTVGGPAPKEVRRMIGKRKEILARDQARAAQRQSLPAQAAGALRDACKALMEN